jgi:hypothetical protein
MILAQVEAAPSLFQVEVINIFKGIEAFLRALFTNMMNSLAVKKTLHANNRAVSCTSLDFCLFLWMSHREFTPPPPKQLLLSGRAGIGWMLQSRRP